MLYGIILFVLNVLRMEGFETIFFTLIGDNNLKNIRIDIYLLIELMEK